MPLYSELVKRHIEEEFISDEYLLNTDFTYKDLEDITHCRLNLARPPKRRSKIKMTSSSSTYSDYLSKSGLKTKNNTY